MEDIAAEAEVGKGTLYRYFQDKEELFLALLERAAKQLLERVQAEIAPVEGARARLVVITATLIRYFEENYHLSELIQRAELLRGRSMPWQRVREELFKLWVQVCEEGRQRREFEIVDVELGAATFLFSLRGIFRFPECPRPPDLAERLVDHFLNGYRRP